MREREKKISRVTNIGNFAEYCHDVWTIDHSGLIRSPGENRFCTHINLANNSTLHNVSKF